MLSWFAVTVFGFSNGIIFWRLLGGALVLFHGIQENLIPLYAVGVFIPFTLSQLGMMVRWIALNPPIGCSDSSLIRSEC